jgi:hypothetical protein
VVATTYVSQLYGTALRQPVFDLITQPLSNPFDTYRNEVSLQGLLNNSRTLLVPSFSGLAVAGTLKRFTELPFKPGVGIWMERDGDHNQMFMFCGEDVKELRGFEHLCDRFIVEVFEVLQMESEPLSTGPSLKLT